MLYIYIYTVDILKKTHALIWILWGKCKKQAAKQPRSRLPWNRATRKAALPGQMNGWKIVHSLFGSMMATCTGKPLPAGECLWPNQQQRKALGKSGDEHFRPRLLTIARNCEDMVVPRPKYPHKHVVSTSLHLKAETEAAAPIARPTGSDAGQQMEKRLLGWSNSTWLIPPIELNTYNCYTGKTKAPTKTPLKTGFSSKW